MGVRIASGLCPSPARHNLNVAGAVNLSWGFKLCVILSIFGASPVESDHHGYRPQWRRECQFPLLEAFSTFLQLLQLWLRANRRWRRQPIRSTAVPAKKALNVISMPSRSRADPPLARSDHLGRRAFCLPIPKTCRGGAKTRTPAEVWHLGTQGRRLPRSSGIIERPIASRTRKLVSPS